MAKTDMRFSLFNDVLIALSLLTRLPVPHANWDDVTKPRAQAAWAYPLAGLVVAGLGLVVAGASNWCGLPPPISALLFLLTAVMATGAMHEDGLADCADGFWGGWTVSQRLDIMKDSAIGTYGVLALLFSFTARWTLYTVLFSTDAALLLLLIPAVLSRSAMVGVMQTLPAARTDGLSVSTGKPGMVVALGSSAIGILSAFFLVGVSAFALVASAALGAGLIAFVARIKIGGQTGDVLGATQQVCEILILIAISAFLSA